MSGGQEQAGLHFKFGWKTRCKVEKRTPAEFVASGCSSRTLRSGRLRAAEMYYLTVLEAGSLKSRWRSHAPFETLGGTLPCPFQLLAVASRVCLLSHVTHSVCASLLF